MKPYFQDDAVAPDIGHSERKGEVMYRYPATCALPPSSLGGTNEGLHREGLLRADGRESARGVETPRGKYCLAKVARVEGTAVTTQHSR